MSTRQTSKVRRSAYVDGVRVWGCGATAREAEQHLRTKIADTKQEMAIPINRRMTVAMWSNEYLRDYKQPALTYDALKVLEVIARKWVIPYIGAMKIAEVKSIHVQRILNEMAAKGLSGKYIRSTRFHIQDMFEKAIANELTYDNPVRHVTMPRATDGSHRALTESERASFLRACETATYGTYGLFLYHTGCRPGETETVLIKDIDFETKTVHLHGTKNQYADRIIPMPSELATRLQKEVAGRSPFENLFLNSMSRPLTKTNRKDYFNLLKKEWHISLGGRTDYGKLRRAIPPYAIDMSITSYDLRHTYATRMMELGVPVDIAAKLMGHSDLQMLGRIYQHFTPTAMEVARALMDQGAQNENITQAH